MKTLLVMFAAVLMVLGLSMVGLAQGEKPAMGSDQPMASGSNMGSMENVHSFIGTVTAVDMMAKTITVKGRAGEKTFDISKATTGEILTGEVVRVNYTERGEGMVSAASSVTMVKPKLSNNAKEGIVGELGVHNEGM